MTETPEPLPPAPPQQTRPFWREPRTLIAAAALAALLVAGGVLAWRAFAPSGRDSEAYTVQAYRPQTELITARERVLGRERPEEASPVAVMFGQGVTLNVTGRVARGLLGDWYAVSWNDRIVFVRQADAVPGRGAPPPLPERAPREEEEEEPEKEPTKPEDEEVVAELPEPARSGTLSMSDLDWVRQPSGRDLERHFPRRALEANQSGSVELDCIVGRSGRLACSVASENPPGYGFGEAAMAIARQARVEPTLRDGTPAANRHVRVPMSFRAD